MRQILREQLPSHSFDENGLLQKEAMSIAFQAFSGYNFIVSFFAIVALGGISTSLIPEEALHFLGKTKATSILVEEGTFENATAIRNHVQNQTGQGLNIIRITRSEPNTCPQLEINEQFVISPTAGCLVLFTSGTTALPKGVVLPRQLFYPTPEVMPRDILYLARTTAQWVGGSTGMIDSVLYGQRIHVMKDSSNPARFWEVLKEGKVTVTSMPPAFLRTLMGYYNENISCMPPEDREKYINGARSLRHVFTSGYQLDPSLYTFFTDLTNMPIRNGYGITEMGGAVTISPKGSAYVEGYIGTPVPGITVKLSDGEHGEILVKHPNMFIEYINDEAATKAAFDHEGFYKTGDYAERIGNDYFFKGRVSSDWVRFHEHTISVLELEHCLMDLPYIFEAHVLPVQDREAGGLIAALVEVQKPNETEQDQGNINLRRIREDLAAANLVSHKLPALLRILPKNGEVPRTASGKVLKKRSPPKIL
ncbi:hypothetical protein BDV36DRAFT_299488 [Aspergillus pseudocaelatus]|uniref:AMP-dependent synthetase/ligase domain-containing protein n=1 Tax=Aspergillus pseudocaelatus TaxID=1825620 RepID=A0ABQ6WA39_9EURO|nr:hypothetical protein BDV36DRAFT_299488 [Aspergillus pseudocaelatus]